MGRKGTSSRRARVRRSRFAMAIRACRMGGNDGRIRRRLLRAARDRRHRWNCLPLRRRRIFRCAAHAYIGVRGAPCRGRVPLAGVPGRCLLRWTDRPSACRTGEHRGRIEGNGPLRGRSCRAHHVRDRCHRHPDRARRIDVRCRSLRVCHLHQFWLACIPPGGGFHGDSGRVARCSSRMAGVGHLRRGKRQVVRHVDRRGDDARFVGIGRRPHAPRTGARSPFRYERLRSPSPALLRGGTFLDGPHPDRRVRRPCVDPPGWGVAAALARHGQRGRPGRGDMHCYGLLDVLRHARQGLEWR